MRISDWSSDVCSSDLAQRLARWRAWRWRWAAWRQATQDGVFTIFAGKRAQSSRLQVWEWRNPIFGMPRNWQARAAIQTPGSPRPTMSNASLSRRFTVCSPDVVQSWDRSWRLYGEGRARRLERTEANWIAQNMAAPARIEEEERRVGQE